MSSIAIEATTKTEVPVTGSWCETCRIHLGGPVTGARHHEVRPDHRVVLRINRRRWVRYS